LVRYNDSSTGGATAVSYCDDALKLQTVTVLIGKCIAPPGDDVSTLYACTGNTCSLSLFQSNDCASGLILKVELKCDDTCHRDLLMGDPPANITYRCTVGDSPSPSPPAGGGGKVPGSGGGSSTGDGGDGGRGGGGFGAGAITGVVLASSVGVGAVIVATVFALRFVKGRTVGGGRGRGEGSMVALVENVVYEDVGVC
jgi:hypothetical protein